MSNGLAAIYHLSWIVGVALLLARLSILRWVRHEYGRRAVRRTPNDLLVGLVAYVLIAVGLVGISNTLLERLLWLAIASGLIALHIRHYYLAANTGNRSTRTHGN